MLRRGAGFYWVWEGTRGSCYPSILQCPTDALFALTDKLSCITAGWRESYENKSAEKKAASKRTFPHKLAPSFSMCTPELELSPRNFPIAVFNALCPPSHLMHLLSNAVL